MPRKLGYSLIRSMELYIKVPEWQLVMLWYDVPWATSLCTPLYDTRHVGLFSHSEEDGDIVRNLTPSS
jgi:hypothetical protein